VASLICNRIITDGQFAVKSKNMYSVYLIRHAQPDWSRTDLVYHQPPGPPLTDEGRDQARQLGLFMLQAGIQRLYTSPLERCAQTAQIVGELVKITPDIHDGLIEWQPGEDYAAVQARLRPIFEQAVDESAAGPVGLVTHGGPIAAQLMALGMSDTVVDRYRVFDRNNPVPTAGAWLVQRAQARETWSLSLAYNPWNGNDSR
jgi:broad specificity phosphatase PhoE